MTIEEMHRRIQLRVQKINSNAFDDFLSEEIDEYLNEAISRFVKERLVPQSNILQEGFEQSNKRIEDLRELVVKDQNIDTVQVTTGFAATRDFFVDRGDFPNDYMYLLSTRFISQYSRQGVTFTLNSGKRIIDGAEGTDYVESIVRGRYIQSDDIYKILEDPHNTTKALAPIYDLSEDGIDVYTDDKFIIDEIIVNYIREPATVLLDEDTPANNVDCDLAESTHPEIVSMAAELMLADIENLGTGAKIESLRNVE